MNPLLRRWRAPVLGVAAALLAVLVIAALHRADRSDADCCDDVGTVALGDTLDAGLAVVIDSLPNGLRYYVHARPSGGDRTELRLVVDAGALQEADDQRGLAHAVEHMVFRGTRAYPRGAIERYFDDLGMRRGDDVNATTSLDDTQYRLTVPTARPGAIDTALAMLAGVAHEATFDAADARREAGVLLEEWRLSRDAAARVDDARHRLLYAGTAYVDRPTIGDTGVLRRFDLGAIRRFYDAWYRPALMAVVVVGPVDAKAVEALVRRHFAALPARGTRPARPARPAPVATGAALRASLVVTPEARSAAIGLWQPRARQRYRTNADYRAALVATLWRDLLRTRLDNAAGRGDSPFAGTDVDFRTLSRTMAAEVVDVTPMKGQTLPALDALVTEVRDLARREPAPAELAQSRGVILRRLQAGAEYGDGSADLAAEFVDHFLSGNAVLTHRAAYDLARSLLPTITARDVMAFAQTHAADRGAVLVVSTPPDDPVARATSDTLVARVRAVRGGASAPADEALDRAALLDAEPSPGQIVATQAVPGGRAYEWTLSNGMRVLLKPTSFLYDEVRVRAVAPGGASLAGDSAYPSAYLADAILGETGVGRLPAPRLRRWLAGTSIALTPSVSDDAITLDGRAAPDDLEALFRLLHLYLTAPRRDTAAFRRYQTRMVSLLEDRGRDPDAVFRDSLDAAFAGGDPRARRTGAPFYRGARLDDALDFWARRTANGTNFTVAIVGDFTLGRVHPLLERYLASIPRGVTERPRERARPVGVTGVRREVASGAGPRARMAIGFAGPIAVTTQTLDALGAVREVVERALTERLREAMGGTYGVDVSLAVDDVPPARYTMTVEFEAAPERIDALAMAAVDELAALRRRGPTDAQFVATREAAVRDFDGRLEDNAFWAGELTYHATHGWPLAGIAAHARDAAAMTRDDMRRACAQYIPGRDYVRVTARPRPTARRGPPAAPATPAVPVTGTAGQRRTPPV